MDAISPTIKSIIDLFATELSEVRFPGVDGESLARAAASVGAATEALTAAQNALTAARDSLQSQQEALQQQVQRAVAYARVYAENDAALTAKIDALALPRPTRRPRLSGEPPPPSAAGATAPSGAAEGAPAPKPRGRPKKVRPEESDPAAEGDRASSPVQN